MKKLALIGMPILLVVLIFDFQPTRDFWRFLIPLPDPERTFVATMIAYGMVLLPTILAYHMEGLGKVFSMKDAINAIPLVSTLIVGEFIMAGFASLTTTVTISAISLLEYFVIVPGTEEFIFRAYLLKAAKKYFGDRKFRGRAVGSTLAVVFSSAVFMAAHSPADPSIILSANGILGLGALFLGGYWFGSLYEFADNNLFVPIAFHGFYDFAVLNFLNIDRIVFAVFFFAIPLADLLLIYGRRKRGTKDLNSMPRLHE